MRAAVARCLVAGSNNVTAGARQVGLRDNDASLQVVLCWACANAGFFPPKAPSAEVRMTAVE